MPPRLREQTERYDNALTIPAFLANRFPSKATALRLVSAIIIVLFFAVYTASGLVAGGKLFISVFEGGYMTGVWLTLGVVLAYTVIGGFLAVSLTDFVQGCIMMLALVIMPIVVLYTGKGGGFGQAAETLSSVDPNFLSLTHGLTAMGFLSAVTWGGLAISASRISSCASWRSAAWVMLAPRAISAWAGWQSRCWGGRGCGRVRSRLCGAQRPCGE